MTEPQPTDPELEALYAEYARLKPQVDELSERFEAVKQGLKVKLTAAYAGQHRIDVTHPALAAPLRLSYVVQWRLDTKAIKEHDPETYARYAKKSGAWKLQSL